MKKIIILSFILNISLMFSQTYCAGDQVSLEDQNLIHVVGAGHGDYEEGSQFSLADFNGELNGGNYSIIFIDMSASWWGPCQSNAPIVDGLEDDWSEFGVKFITSLSDAGQPYSCSEWQSGFGNSEAPLVLDENQSSTGMFGLFHDSWNAFPTFALLDHTMTVRAKPWTLDNNTNSNSCDGSNNTIDGFSGGSTASFIQQLVDECGTLCEGCSGDIDTDGDGLADECDDCLNMSGDVNDDMTLDILDIISTVNIILNGGINSPNYTDCEKVDADFNQNGIINILDVIGIINTILDARYVDIEGSANINIIHTSNNSSILKIKSDVLFSGIELIFHSESVNPEIILKDNPHIEIEYINENNITRMLAYSISNESFINNQAEIVINNANLKSDMMNMIIASPSADELEISYSFENEVIQSGPYQFELTELFPNPFNPTTTINYTVPVDGIVEISVYNVLGENVKILKNEFKNTGTYNFVWDATEFSSGVYYIKLRQNGNIDTQKAVLVK